MTYKQLALIEFKVFKKFIKRVYKNVTSMKTIKLQNIHTKINRKPNGKSN